LGRRIFDHDYLIRSELDEYLWGSIWLGADPNLPVDSVLDVGCGDRPYKDWFKGCNYIPVDYHSGDIFVNGENLPIKSESIDLFFSTQVLEHVSDPQRFVDEAYRVLKPDGYAVISTHGTYPIHADPDYWRWTEQGLRDLFAGWDIEIYPVGSYWRTTWQLAVLAVNATPFKSLIPIMNILGSLDIDKSKRLPLVYVIVGGK